MITPDGTWGGNMKDRLEMFFGQARDEKEKERKVS